MRVAVMQPYFYPYMGYFRLIAAVDLFVVFDCVQFPRRGRVHRAPLPAACGGAVSGGGASGEGRAGQGQAGQGQAGQGQAGEGQAGGAAAAAGDAWLTLPLARQPRETAIRDIRLAADRDARWQARLARLAWLSDPALAAQLAAPLPERLLPLLMTHLRLACARLGLQTPLCRSSELAIPPGLRGQERVIALAGRLGAREYWNLPGGRALYDPAAFAAAGMALRFLPTYVGPHMSMLHAFCHADPAALRRDLHAHAGADVPPAGAEAPEAGGTPPGGRQ